MKRILSVLIFVLLIFPITACEALEDEVLVSLGEYDSCVFYSEGLFQDFTDYAKYYYTKANVEGNEYFAKIQEDDLSIINEHIYDFEIWVELLKDGDVSSELAINYDFDRSIIDEEDYIYIDSEKHTWDDGTTSLVNYDVYFFDTQTLVLYYFHNNI